MEVLQEIRKARAVDFEPQPSPMVTGWLGRRVVRLRIIWHLFTVAWHEHGSLIRAVHILKTLNKKYHTFCDEPMFSKIAKVDGRYFWRVAAPGYPSKALKLVHAMEVNRLSSSRKHPGLRTLLLGVTRKCPMHCQHCYEWHNLHQSEILSSADLKEIVHKYQQYGTGQIIFGGGEPMLRLKELCAIVQQAEKSTEFWLYTSGFRLNAQEATQLKMAGFTGVMVSLDHHRAEKHDAFRGFTGAYQNAIHAVLASKDAGLVVGLPLCVTNEYTTKENIQSYMQLAHRLGATFVQFLEPKAAGRYAGQDVLLKANKQHLLESLCRMYNHDAAYRDFPIVNYPESIIRLVGCLSGDRILYINTIGEVQQCPFCSNTSGNVLDLSVEYVMDQMKEMSCPDYQKNQV